MARTAGYSGKPLARKLGLKAGLSAVVVAAPRHYDALVEGFPVAHAAGPGDVEGDHGFLHLFCREKSDLEGGLVPLLRHLGAGGMIWVSWPKKSSRLWRDLTEDDVRRVALPLGLVDVKVCAVDEDWSGLKLVRRKTK